MAINTPIHTNASSIDRVIGTGAPVLLVFWRRNCAPCDQLKPALDHLASAYAGRALVAKIDVQDSPDLARRFGIAQLPGLVFAAGGATVAQTSGAAPEADLRAWFDHLLGGGPRPALPTGPSIPLDDTARSQPANASPAQGTQAASGATAPQALTDATFTQVIGADQPVLVDFWAPWCGPCRAVAPSVERLAGEFAGRATVAKLNVDENPRTAQRYGITGIPALFIFKHGQVVERLVGAQPYPVLRQALMRHVGA